MVMKYSDLYLRARRAFLDKEDPRQAGLLARELLQFVSGKSQEELIADGDKYAPEPVIQQMDKAVERIVKGEPLAYVLGEWDFYGLKLVVTPDVLIPRDDTCALAEAAIRQALFLDPAPRILDLCTGSGCIGLAIATRVKDARVTLADLSRSALAVAKKNVTNHKLSGRVSCVQADAMQEPPAFLGKFDMIVSNPPYVTTEEMTQLDDSVKDYEPHMALWGGADGLDFYRSIAKRYRKCLKPGGYLCFEFGMGQGNAVCDILTQEGFEVTERVMDYNERERACLARYCREEN